MQHRLTPLQKRYWSFVLWGAVNGVIGAFGVVLTGIPLGDHWAELVLGPAFVSTVLAALVFLLLVRAPLLLQCLGFLVVGFLISPVLVFGSNLVQYGDLRCHGSSDCALVELLILILLWLIFLILGAISAGYWAIQKAGRI